MNDELEKFWGSGSFWGDSKLIPFIKYRRKTRMKCIYCGKEANTREHCPSKAFLEDPLPTDLIVLPACSECNNGFSSDELYVRPLLNAIKIKITGGSENNVEFERPEEKEAVVAAESILKTHRQIRDARVERILLKLAIGHIAYPELFTVMQ